ncbi:hypothetical protein R1sor_024679 [Riccia sorocarpa]|uniref:Uncharacterized protein n=1 Tax=Riccia sorocarpa TaxID=122646 RepID=A0ABD3GR72_9MARC
MDSESEAEEDEDDHRIEATCREGDREDELEDQAGKEEVFEPDDVNNCKEELLLKKASRCSSRADTHIKGKCSRPCTASSRGECIELVMPEVIERLGTPASVSRVLASSTLPHPNEALDTALDADMVEFYQLKDSLCESNLDAEGALQTVLSHTIGGLDYGCNMMIKRAHERMKNLHVQMGQEIVEMFFAPKISKISTPNSTDDYLL